MPDLVRLVLHLAVRSLVAHRIKSGFVGLILAFGTFLVVVGLALIDSIDRSMQDAITSSLAGDLQVYDADAEDPLALFGGMGMGTTDYGDIPAFEAVSELLHSVENVDVVVPMGITNVTVFGKNEIDRVLNDLRKAAVHGGIQPDSTLVARARRIIDDFAEQADERAAIAHASAADKHRRALQRASSDAFWDQLSHDPFTGLDFLDSEIAPLASDGRLFYLRLIGTDPQLFTDSFPRFYIVDGQPIPEGRRGFLFSKRTYEQVIKNQVARELDDLLEAHRDGERIADDPLLADRVKRNAKQYRRVTFQLAPARASILQGELEQLLGTSAELGPLVQQFLTTDDDTVEVRHAFFYEHIAPHIDLYEIPVGSDITLRGFTQSGYMRSINVRVYGTYELRGLEEAGLQVAGNLSDLVTFRELYGKMSAREQAELAEIKQSVGVQHVDRDNAEDLLFGAGTVLSEAQPAAPIEITIERDEAQSDQYPLDELRNGLVLNAAILLRDPSRAKATTQAIEHAIAQSGLRLQVVDWAAAAGIIGQFLGVMRLVLYVALVVIYGVAMIIINNAMVTSTLDRTGEIGAMRAIGAQRIVVVALFVVETVVLALLAGGLGVLLGVALITWLGQVGIPAPAEVLVLLFAGERLYPSVGLVHVAVGMITVTGVSLVSVAWPALLAAGIQPVIAMGRSE